jgi:hypothetical protein
MQEAENPPALALIDRRVRTTRGVNDVSTLREATWTSPGRPEHHREHDPQGSDAHEYPADGVDVEGTVGWVDVKGEGEDGANRQQKDPNS